MSTIIEKRSEELMNVLINKMDSLDKAHDPDEEEPLGGYVTPDDVSCEFYDNDLLEIQAMSNEDVASELASLGYDDTVISQGVAACSDDKVIAFPDPRKHDREVEAKLQSTLITALIQEALYKTTSLTKKSSDTEYSQQVVDTYTDTVSDDGKQILGRPPANDNLDAGSASNNDTEKKLRRYKNAFGIAASLLVAVTTFSIFNTVKDDAQIVATSPATEWGATDSYLSSSIQRTVAVPKQSTNPFGLTLAYNREQSPAYTPDIILEYESTMQMLDKIGSGELEASSVERLRIAQKLQEVAIADSLKVQLMGGKYQESNTCASVGVYEHVIASGDSLSGVLSGCAYVAGDPEIFKVDQVLNINDILVMQINDSRVVTKIDIDRVDGTSSTLYSYSKE